MGSKPDFMKEYKEQVPEATLEELEAEWAEELKRRAQQVEREDKRLAAEREEKAAEREEKRLAAEREEKRQAAEREEKRQAAEREEKRLAAEREEKRLAAEAEREEKRLAAEREEKRLEREFQLQRIRLANQGIGDGTFSRRSCNLHSVCSFVSSLAAVVCVLVLGFYLSHFHHFLCLPIQQEV
jgi:hypothetical protein